MTNSKNKKYKGVFRDANGKIFYQIELGTDPVTGKRIQKKGRKNQYGKPFETTKEAYDEVIRLKSEFFTLVTLENYTISFEDYMNNIYLRAYKQKVQSVTYKTALAHHKYFIQYFGNQELKSISPRDCEIFRLHIIEKYSENYAKNMWSRFKACLGYAERLGYIGRLPCKGLDSPKGKHPETPFWTYADFQKVIPTFDVTNYEGRHQFTTIWLYYMTGVRVSEGIALKWSDFDFENKLLHVHATIEKDENGEWFAKQQTKTRAGMRYIDLDDVTIEVLKNWRSIQIAHSDEDYVISRFGEPLCKTTICRIIKRHANLANIPVITGKGLRHSHASYLINVLKMDTLYVSHRLGHADSATTLNTYSHWYHAGNATISEEITRSIQSVGINPYPAKSLPK